LAIGRVILSIGKNKKSAIYILVDRKLLYTVVVKLNGKNATELANKTIKVLEPISNKIHTITYDNGLIRQHFPKCTDFNKVTD
jgi:IS30 family transposase